MKTYLYRASNLKSTIAFLAFVSERREELSNTCNPKVMSRYPSAPDATSLHHIPTSQPQEQAAKTNMASVVRIQAFSFMYS